MLDWTAVLVAAIGAGLLKFAADAIKWIKNWRAGKTSEARDALHVVTADQSLTVVARARDELEADNDRLRRQRAEDLARYEADRARWNLREAAMREEIDALERKLRALLSEVERLKDRHTFGEVDARRTAARIIDPRHPER